MVMPELTRNRRTWGGLVTVAVILSMLTAMAVTLLGSGAANHAIASFDASSWLWSNSKGEIARVNGVTGRVDTRYKVSDGQGHTMQVTQNDRYVVLRDLSTGRISVLDLAGLKIGSSTQTTAGLGITVALHDDTAFLIDSTQGLVRQMNPATLTPVGQAMSFPPGIVGGGFDDKGRLWLLVPSEGTAVAITPARLTSAGPNGGVGGGTGGGQPAVLKTVAVADPGHDLTLSILDTGVAVLDKTTAKLVTVRGDAERTVTLTLSGLGALPNRTVGSDIPVTVVDDRHVYIVTGDKVAQFTVPSESPRLQPCVAWSGRFYCADDATGTVYVLDAGGQALDPIKIANPGGPLELEVREKHLFINAPSASTARVVDSRHRVKIVDKYANNVLGGDPPPPPPAPPPPPKPAVGPPGAPTKATATAGNAQVTVAWGAAAPNGAAITKYVIEGDAAPHEFGASQRSAVITGLTNGKEYRFSVYAVNAKGPGPKRAANPVIPTSDVPDPPLSVTAKESPDGSVTVTWPAANGQGHAVPRYEVTPFVAGAPDSAVAIDATTLTLKPGSLKYGTQVAFKVVSINDKGAASVPSPLSNTVVPFTIPGPIKGLKASTVSNKRGTITLAWTPPEDNGRPIVKYQVTANGKAQDVTGGSAVTLAGFGDGADVAVKVVAVNEAGASAPAEASARTVAAPTLTLSAATGATNTVNISFVANDGGGTPATCSVAIAGAYVVAGRVDAVPCGSSNIGSVYPGNAYSFTVTITNAAGMTASASGTVSTPALFATVICNDLSKCGKSKNQGIYVYTTPSQNGKAVNDVTSPESYEAICKVDTGTSINAEPWGGHTSTWWVKIKFNGENYIPYAWVNVNMGALHTC
jgi:hypothetical protein